MAWTCASVWCWLSVSIVSGTLLATAFYVLWGDKPVSANAEGRTTSFPAGFVKRMAFPLLVIAQPAPVLGVMATFCWP
jgi:hypothetical protein